MVKDRVVMGEGVSIGTGPHSDLSVAQGSQTEYLLTQGVSTCLLGIQ